jgi:Coenzyme PQQ synthesis protein D (PqqD)
MVFEHRDEYDSRSETYDRGSLTGSNGSAATSGMSPRWMSARTR